MEKRWGLNRDKCLYIEIWYMPNPACWIFYGKNRALLKTEYKLHPSTWIHILTPFIFFVTVVSSFSYLIKTMFLFKHLRNISVYTLAHV